MLDRSGPTRLRAGPGSETRSLSLSTLPRPSDLSAWPRLCGVRLQDIFLAVVGEPQADAVHRTSSVPQPESSCNGVGLDQAGPADAMSRLRAVPGTPSPA